MSLPKFSYLSPSELKEACDILKDMQGRAAIFAGGTELVPHLKWRIKLPDFLLSLKNISSLMVLQNDNETGLIVGAMCSLKTLSSDYRIRYEFTTLAQSAERVASPQIRNRATIGGNVCLDTRCWYYDRSKQWRSAFSPCYKAGGDKCHVVKGGRQCYALLQADTVPSLLVLKAKIKLVKADGYRVISLDEFYSGLGESPNAISSGEILTEIHIPRLSPHSGSAYCKYQVRGSPEFPILGAASLVTLDKKGESCREARFAVVGHGSEPLLIDATEFLRGIDKPLLTDDIIDLLLKEVKPVNHMGVSVSLKRHIARVMIQEAFLKSWHNAEGKEDRD